MARSSIWDNGQIGHTIATGVPASWHVVGVGDFDGNGKSDIVWHNDNGAVAIWDNAPDRTHRCRRRRGRARLAYYCLSCGRYGVMIRPLVPVVCSNEGRR